MKNEQVIKKKIEIAHRHLETLSRVAEKRTATGKVGGSAECEVRSWA